jgi:UPF0716 protein FxsA
MRILAILATLFILLPVGELALLLRVGRVLGFWPTLGLVLLTGVAGAALARREGVRTLSSFRSQVAGGAIPGRALMDGACILVGGALLLTPGFLTDAFGLSLIFPPTRRLIQRVLQGRIEAGLASGRIQVVGVPMPGGFPGGGASGPTPDRGGGPRRAGGSDGVILDAEVVETRVHRPTPEP